MGYLKFCAIVNCDPVTDCPANTSIPVPPGRESCTACNLNRVAIGSTIQTTAIIGLIINILVMYVQIRRRRLTGKAPVTNRLYFNLLVCDSMQLLLVVIYLGPTCIMNKSYLDVSTNRFFLMMFNIGVTWFWFETLTTIIIIAFNRYVLVCKPIQFQRTTRTTINWLLLLTWSITFLFAFGSARMSFLHHLCAYGYSCDLSLNSDGTDINYSELIIQLPLCIITTICLIYCYVQVIRHLIAHTAKARSNMMSLPRAQSERVYEERRQTQIRRTIELCVVAVTFVVSWTSLRMLMMFHNDWGIMWIGSIMVILNSSVNGILMLSNKNNWRALFKSPNPVVSPTIRGSSNTINSWIIAQKNSCPDKSMTGSFNGPLSAISTIRSRRKVGRPSLNVIDPKVSLTVPGSRRQSKYSI